MTNNAVIMSLACYKGSLRDTATLFFQFTVFNRGQQRTVLTIPPGLFFKPYIVQPLINACCYLMFSPDKVGRSNYNLKLFHQLFSKLIAVH